MQGKVVQSLGSQPLKVKSVRISNSGHWTAEEELTLLEKYQKYGSKWLCISQQMPGRCENTLKNKFHSLRKEAATIQSTDPALPPFKDNWLESVLSEKRKLMEEGTTLATKHKQTANGTEVNVGDEDLGFKLLEPASAPDTPPTSDGCIFELESQRFMPCE